MMNLIAIILVTTSLAFSGVLSPNPQTNNNGGDQIILKNGQRAVVVEYDDVTKVSISPAKPNKAHNGPIGASPRELICDAYGKCKHKLAGAWGKAKEKASEAEEEVKEVVDKAKDYTQGVRQNAKEKIKEANEGFENLKGEVGEKAKEMVGNTTEEIKEKGIKGKKKFSDIFKRGKDLVFGSIGYVFRVPRGIPLMGMIQIMGFSMAYGISVWVTFIMSHVLAGVLPRQQFGMVQSKIYPVYFKAMVGSIGLGLIGHLLGERGMVFKNKAEMLQGYNLLGCLLSVLANLLFLEPKATKVMFQRMKLEKEEGRGRRDQASTPSRVIDTDGTTGTTTNAAATPPPPPPPRPAKQDEGRRKLGKVDERLKKLNSYSSLLNIMSLMGLIWPLVYLSQRLGGVNHS